MLVLLFLTAAVLFGLFMYTQVLHPAYRGRKLFPYFRPEKELQQKLLDLDQAEYEQHLADIVRDREFKAAQHEAVIDVLHKQAAAAEAPVLESQTKQ